jgi:hypothetical protein
MRAILISIIFLMSAVMVYAQTESSTSNTTGNHTTYTPFEEDYTKPRPQDNKTQSANETNTSMQPKEEMSIPGKVLVSK